MAAWYSWFQIQDLILCQPTDKPAHTTKHICLLACPCCYCLGQNLGLKLLREGGGGCWQDLERSDLMQLSFLPGRFRDTSLTEDRKGEAPVAHLRRQPGLLGQSLRGGLEATCIRVAWRSVKMQSPGPHIQPADSGGWRFNKLPRWNLLKVKNFSTEVSIPSPLISFLPATSFSLPFTEDEIFIWGFPESQADSMNW